MSTQNQYGIAPQNDPIRDAFVLEKFDARYRDYEGKGKFLFAAQGTIASGNVVLGLPLKPGAKVSIFGAVIGTVTTDNQVSFDAVDYGDGTSFSEGETVDVLVLANQSDIKTAGQPH